MSLIQKIKRNFVIFFHSLFFGMRGGDTEMLRAKTQGIEPDYHSEQEVEANSVFQDLLREKETQRVKETRDATYRVFRESNKYIVEGDFGDDVTEFKPRIVKKSDAFYSKAHCNIAQLDTDKVKLIQDQIEFENDTQKKASEADYGYSVDPDRLIKCEYDGFIPSMDASKYLKRIVVFDSENDFNKIELYFPDMAGMFSKTDAIFLKKLKDCLNGDLKNFDALDIDSIEFVTNKAFGSEDLMMYKFSNLMLKEMFVFDGNIIVSFVGKPIFYGYDMIEKYRTKELDQKYEKKSPKGEAIDINILMRDKNNGQDIDK